MKTLATIVIVFLLSGCKWSNADLGDSYYYLESAEAIDIGFPDGAIIYKSTNQYVFKDIKVSREVIQVEHDDTYILAKQVCCGDGSDTNFFVINKKSDMVYGPLNADSLEMIRTHFNIKLNF